MFLPKDLELLIQSFTQREEVEGILLAGSVTNGTTDQYSDYDLYIYTYRDIAPEVRAQLTAPYTENMEINNQFWETEDDGFLKENRVPIEIIYRTYEWIAELLNRTLVECTADVGYSTCFWSNFQSSKILFDRTGRLAALQNKYDIPYPKKLQENIIDKNLPLLNTSMCSYYDQIEKAIKRDDIISIHHRTAALLASYFDILFAINQIPHPGEKKLIKIAKSKCKLLPSNFEENIQAVLTFSATANPQLLIEIDQLIDNLKTLLERKTPTASL